MSETNTAAEIVQSLQDQASQVMHLCDVVHLTLIDASGNGEEHRQQRIDAVERAMVLSDLGRAIAAKAVDDADALRDLIDDLPTARQRLAVTA